MMAPSVQNALKGAMNTQAGPSNPATPPYRENPEHDWYTALQRVRITAKEAVERVGEEKGPIVKSVLSAIRNAAEQLMAGIDPAQVATATASSLVETTRPDVAALLKSPPATPAGPAGANALGMPAAPPPPPADAGSPGGPLAAALSGSPPPTPDNGSAVAA
jgi:hypothetical protein